MKFKIFLCILLTVALCMLGIISCNSDKENSLKFLCYFVNINEKNDLLKIIKDIETEFDCKIELSFYDITKGPGELISLLNQKKFDIVTFDSEWLEKLKISGVLKSIDTSFVINEKLYNPLHINYCKIDNKYFCLPWLINTRLLYFNDFITKKYQINNPPENLQKLLINSEVINEAGKYYGISLTGPNKNLILKNMLPFIYSYGATLVDSSLKPTLDNHKIYPGIYYYLKLGNAGIFETKREVENLIINDKSAYCISDLSLLQKIIKNNLSGKIGFSQLPPNLDGNLYSYSNIVMLGVGNNSHNQNLAMRFIVKLSEWNKTDDFTIELMKYGIPSIINFSCDFIDSKQLSIIKEQINKSFMAPKLTYWNDLENIFEKEIVKAIYLEKSIEGSMNDAQGEILNFLKKNKME
ncbi:MAG: hypothetical protein HZB41_00710 [Ignavibacteriae bacterium]|nr:hypothetical protein [Ignavibacteriota bacterium]